MPQEKPEKVEQVYTEGVISAKKIKPDLRKKESPLVDIKVTNPITYIKSWWNKIIGNEGIELRVKVRPLTAIAISIIILTVTLGIGKFVLPFRVPFFVYTSKENSGSTTDHLHTPAHHTGDRDLRQSTGARGCGAGIHQRGCRLLLTRPSF